MVMGAMAVAGDTADKQLWSTLTFYKNLADRFMLRVGPEVKWAENISTHYLTRYEIGLSFSGHKGISYSLAYKRILINDENSTTVYNVPYFDFSLAHKIKWLTLDLRHRIEFFSARAMTPFFRFRQRIKITPVSGVGIFNIRPFVSEEYFVDMNGIGLKTNRVNGGAMLDLCSLGRIEIYYLFQNNKGAEGWLSDHVLGANFSLYL